ncbi:MAG: chromosome partitioning protein ParA [Burkholderiales bacterium]|nr:chromosome partitioning protein ParA [Burkholderiales bacterium]
MLLALLAAQAMAQTDPPGRVARLNLNEGSVAFSPAGDTEWTDAVLNRPLTQGDRLWTDRGSRAELHAGAIALRMNSQTHLAFVALDDHATQISLNHGALQARVRELADGDSFQLDTPNLSLRAAQAGEYRVEVDPDRGTTRVTVHSGTAVAYGEGGQSLAMGGGQQVEFRGRALVQIAAQEAPPTDVFDRWAAERDRREDQSVSARYVPREVTGYQQLDAWGKWIKDPALGAVWQPRDVDAAWMPFRYGRWDLVAPWGWTWIDEAPWGFATSHYGRWTQLGARWAWVPGRMAARPVYSPALVGFIGNGAAGDSSNVHLGTGRSGVAWFPLAPGEAWKPGYKASPVYVGNVNRNMTAGEPAGSAYVHRRPEALTAIALDDFQHGRPVRGRAQKLALGELARGQVAALPAAPARSSLPQPPRMEMARVAPAQKPPAAPPAAAPAAATPAPPTLIAPPPVAAAPAQPPAKAVQPPAAAPAPARQVTVTREQVQQALQAERARREQAQQAEQAQREQALRAQAQAQARAQTQAAAKAQARAQLAKAQREKALHDQALREQALREQAQRDALLARRKLQQQQEQVARQAQAVKLAKLQKEQAQRDQARRQALAAEKAQQQARHEAQVRRTLSLANADAQARADAQAKREAQARRDEQDRREQQARRDEQDRDRLAQEKAQAQREAQQREQQLLAETRRREQLERRLQQEAQQRQPAPFIVAPPQGIPVMRGSRS